MKAKYSYRPDIDGLRAVAVIAVVLYHLGLPISGGFVGVDIFFVISGYLITRIINKEIAQGIFSFRGFYQRRIRRILPALLATSLVVTCLAIWILLPSDLDLYSRSLLPSLLGFSNIFFWRNTGYFSRGGEFSPLLHTWSLAVEEQFYLLFPPALMLLRRYLPSRYREALTIVGLASLLLASYVVYDRPGSAFFLPMFRAWELLIGCLVALYPARNESRRHVWLHEGRALAALALIIGPILFYSEAMTFPGASAILPCLGAALLIRHEGSFVSRLLSKPPMVFTGLVSYSLYLWHWPLIVFFKHWWYRDPTWVEAAGLGALAYALAVTTWKCVERPFRDKKLLQWRIVAIAVGVPLVLAIGFSILALANKGNFFSRDSLAIQLDAERSPNIPYENCFGRKEQLEAYCYVGAKGGARPSILIWGDSHSLANLPALDSILIMRNRTAIYVGASYCPPIFDMEHRDTKLGSYGCVQVGNDVKALLKNRAISTVVISAAWKRYTTPQDGVSLTLEGNSPDRDSVFQIGLHRTIEFLKENRIHLVVIGPVPSAGFDVPFVMARAARRGLVAPPSPGRYAFVRDYTNFNKVISSEMMLIPFTYIPLESLFFVGEKQVISDNKLPLYRDNGHLNIRGANRLVPFLANKLQGSLHAPSPK